jgi:hypothetical protein
MKTSPLSVLQRAKLLLSPVPDEQWCKHNFVIEETKQCCAIGHYVRLSSPNPDLYVSYNCSDRGIDEAKRDLRTASEEVAKQMGMRGVDIASINNIDSEHYPQPTPKERVMAFLDDAVEFLKKNSPEEE